MDFNREGKFYLKVCILRILKVGELIFGIIKLLYFRE